MSPFFNLRHLFIGILAFSTMAGSGLASTPERRIGDALDSSGLSLSASGSFLAGRVALSLKDSTAAAVFLAEALKADPKNFDLLDRAFLANLSAGDLEAAAAYADRLIMMDPNHRVARLVLGLVAIRAKQFDVARAHLAKAARRPVLDLVAPLLSGWAATGAGDVSKAIEEAKRVKGEEWYEAFKNFSLGLMLDLAGQPDAAIDRLKAAYEADPAPVRVAEAYARMLARANRAEEALKIVDGYLARAPRQPIMVELRDAITKKRQIDRAVVSVQQGAADTLIAIAVPLGRQGGQEFALSFLQLALGLDPTNGPALVAIADTFSDMGQPQNAAKALAAIPATSPLKRNAEISLGLTLDQLDKTDEGIAHLNAILKANPSDFEALITLGSILQNRKRFSEAAEVYNKAVALVDVPNRNHWSLFYYRGIAFERTKQWDKAEKDFRKALELFPDQPDVLNYLGYSWIDQGKNLEEGLAMIRKAVEQKPDSGYIVDSLGWAYYRLKNFPEAVKHLERAVELRPSDAVINDHLGDAYWMVGRKLEATFQWRHALDAKPEPEPDQKILIERKLKEGLPPDSRAAESSKAGSGG